MEKNFKISIKTASISILNIWDEFRKTLNGNKFLVSKKYLNEGYSGKFIELQYWIPEKGRNIILATIKHSEKEDSISFENIIIQNLLSCIDEIWLEYIIPENEMRDCISCEEIKATASGKNIRLTQPTDMQDVLETLQNLIERIERIENGM